MAKYLPPLGDSKSQLSGLLYFSNLLFLARKPTHFKISKAIIVTELQVISFTIHERLSSVAGEQRDAPAIQNELGKSLSHKDLVDQIEYTVAQLNRCGVSRNERVAIVLPQSPELAVAFLAVSAAATAAPLNHKAHSILKCKRANIR